MTLREAIPLESKIALRRGVPSQLTLPHRAALESVNPRIGRDCIDAGSGLAHVTRSAERTTLGYCTKPDGGATVAPPRVSRIPGEI